MTTTSAATSATSRHRSAPAAKTLLEYLAIALSAALLALVLLLAVAVVVLPKIAGATPVTILTTSMEPTLPPGTLIVVKPVAARVVHVGDVVTYQIRPGDPAVVSHRVVAITHTSTGAFTLTTKGDNNAHADPPVLPAQVRGIVWYSIPVLGYVNSALTQGQRSWVMPGIGILLLAYAGYLVVRGALAAVARQRREAER